MSRRVWPVALAALVALAVGCGAEDPTREAAREETQRRQETSPQEITAAETTVGELTIGEVDDAADGRLLVQSGESVVNDSYISPLAEIYGDVEIGAGSFVAENSVLRAAPEQRLEMGAQTNLQDNVVVRALEDDSTIGDRTSVSHHALVRDAEIGGFVFVGFNAEVVDATVGDGALISAGALVEGVEVPEDALVEPGLEVTTQRQADALPTVTAAEVDFKEALLAVNAEFAENYIRLYEDEGYDAVIGAGPNPTTEFNPERVEPQIGTDSELGEFARVVGDVRIGPGSEVGDRASIRADEGAPIIVGRNANVEESVTFHALDGTGITVGDSLDAGDDAVLHGPLEAGDGLEVGDDSVVFRVRVEDNVTIGEDVVIEGPSNEDDPEEPTLVIPEGTEVPDGSVVTSQEDLEVLPESTGSL